MTFKTNEDYLGPGNCDAGNASGRKPSSRKPGAAHRPLPWRRHYTGDFRNLMRGRTNEQVGFLLRVQDAQSELGAPLPRNIDDLRLVLNQDKRTIRRLISLLVAAGMLIETETGFYDPRLMLEILAVDTMPDEALFRPISVHDQLPSATGPDREFEETFGELLDEVGENYPKNPVISTRVFESQKPDLEVSTPARKRDSLAFTSATRRSARDSARPLAEAEPAQPSTLVPDRSGPPWPTGRLLESSWPNHTDWATADQHGEEVPQ